MHFFVFVEAKNKENRWLTSTSGSWLIRLGKKNPQKCQKSQISVTEKRYRSQSLMTNWRPSPVCLVTDFDQHSRYRLTNLPPLWPLSIPIYRVVFHNTAAGVAFFHLTGANSIALLLTGRDPSSIKSISNSSKNVGVGALVPPAPPHRRDVWVW